MIFVTVGTQGHFDRLIRAVDEWAFVRGIANVFAQTGPAEYCPRHIAHRPLVGPTEFRQYVESAKIVIAHAGMGSIITALELGKQIIVMPRRADLGEHRNNHQVATAKRFVEQGRILVAYNEQELLERLDKIERLVYENERVSAQASPILIRRIRLFIEGVYV